jgi:DNA-binding response OmpR family regulator
MIKIVIVDNNEGICDIYADTLKCAGYDVECLNDEEQAVEKICKEQPDLVLLDVLMPKINGLHLLDLILSDRCHKKTVVVMLTELSDEGIRDKALAHGAKDYIVKSEINMSDLLKRIDKVLS